MKWQEFIAECCRPPREEIRCEKISSCKESKSDSKKSSCVHKNLLKKCNKYSEYPKLNVKRLRNFVIQSCIVYCRTKKVMKQQFKRRGNTYFIFKNYYYTRKRQRRRYREKTCREKSTPPLSLSLYLSHFLSFLPFLFFFFFWLFFIPFFALVFPMSIRRDIRPRALVVIAMNVSDSVKKVQTPRLQTLVQVRKN